MLLGQASFADSDSENKAVFAELTPQILPTGWKEACQLDMWNEEANPISGFIEEPTDNSDWVEIIVEDENVIRCRP